MGDIVGRIRGGVWRYERNQEIQSEVSETRRAAPWGGHCSSRTTMWKSYDYTSASIYTCGGGILSIGILSTLLAPPSLLALIF